MIGLMSSCVSKKEFAKLEGIKDGIAQELQVMQKDLNNCNSQLANLKADITAKDQALGLKDAQIAELNQRIQELKTENKQYFDRMGELINNKDASTKELLEMIKNKDVQLAKATELANKLNYKIQAKDSINLGLVLNLKKSLQNINDEDISIQVIGERVYVSISDKLLFKSGSSAVSSSAQTVLEKIARVINAHKDIDVMVEGHTDTKPISTDCVKDNWDLSVDRATAVVRNLQDKYGVDPTRLTASGRAFYMPKADNETNEGRSANRRTEIIITPRLDQFLKLHQIKE